MKLKDRVAIITGSGRGIGKETALLFAEEGAKVVITDIIDEIYEVVEEIREKKQTALAIKADVTKIEDVANMVNKTVNEFGGVDILVNNAGINRPFKLEEMSEKDFDEIMAVNLKGVYNCCKAVIPIMVKQRRGKIVNISSISGVVIGMRAAHYSASKAGVLGLTRTLAVWLAEYGINVNAVCPGIIETEMNVLMLGRKGLMEQVANIPLRRLGRPRDIANTILFLASDDSDYITGQYIVVDGGLTIRSPY
jgi:3-oxoacyl-[acyl-carrier protein] reductase